MRALFKTASGKLTMLKRPPLTSKAACLAYDHAFWIFTDLRSLPKSQRIPALLKLVELLEDDVGGPLTSSRPRKPSP